jgi:DNA repair protein RadC
MPISSWAEDDRPREKLMLKGKATLSDAELIAILIGSGTKDESAVQLSQRILATAKGSLINLSSLNLKDLMKFKGIGEAKAISIISALELGKRRRGAEVLERKKIRNSKDVYEYFYTDLADIDHEEFWILLLNRANDIIRKERISSGGISGTVADPKIIFRIALQYSSSGIILCHNHPSGNKKPSDADLQLTRKVKNAGALLDLPILDHIIVARESYHSMADQGEI